jgi:ribonucleoside-diphosphate reductase alpha chain
MVPLQDLQVGDKLHLSAGRIGTVKSVESTGLEEDVYDVVNTGTHTFIANDFVVSNCGEIPLAASGVCNLSHLNLSAFVKAGVEHFPEDEVSAVDAFDYVDWNRLQEVIEMGVRFLDNAIDINQYHDSDVEKQQKKERRIGLGVMGLGELFIRLGLRYGSRQSEKFTSHLFKFICEKSYLASAKLAEEHGSFPQFNPDKFLDSGFVRKMDLEIKQEIRKKGIRNCTVNTVAPTGSVGTLVNTTTGIEPCFALNWTSKTRIGLAEEQAAVLAPLADKFGEDQDKWPDYVVTAQKGIKPQAHVKIQAKAQKWIDSSISKTINLPNDAKVEDVADCYRFMWREGCKGGTVYRDASRDEQVMYADTKESGKKPGNVEHVVLSEEEYKKRVTNLVNLRNPLTSGIGPTISQRLKFGTVHCSIRCDPVSGEVFDFFVNAGKGEIGANAQALGRLVSIILRWPNNRIIPQRDRLFTIQEQLRKIPGVNSILDYKSGQSVYSLPDAISKVIEKFLEGDYAMSNVPFGDKPLQLIVNRLRKEFDVPEELLDVWFGKETKDKDSDKNKEEKEDGPDKLLVVNTDLKADADANKSGAFFDICPQCKTLNFVYATGKCPRCNVCNYQECGG